MATDFKLPDLGEGIHEAQVVNVMINEGDTVKEDQMVMEVETDKAAVELPVPYAGVVTSLKVKAGDTVTVGQVLLTVSASGEAPAKKTEAVAAKAEAPVAAKAPPRAAEPAPIATPAPARAAKVVEPEEDDEEDAAPAAPGRREVAVAEAPRSGSGPIPAAPAIRRMAREMEIDLHQVHGTGPGGRIVREDVERFALTGGKGAGVAPRTITAEPTIQTRSSDAPAAPTTARGPTRQDAAAAFAGESLPDFAQWGTVRREKVSQIRKTIARQMTRAWTLIPHVTHCDEVDVTDLEAFRKEHGQVFNADSTKLTLTAFILKAVAGALQQFPQFNCSYDEAASEIIHKDYYHIGVAVDTPRGLMVPVLRDVDRKGLVRVSKELKEMADRARDFKIDVSELRGGTFTVTNVGPLGGTMSTPMINYPEVGILGVGKLELKPVVRKGEIVARKMLPLFLSFDHRVVDGADGAKFIRTIISYLENPLNLLLAS